MSTLCTAVVATTSTPTSAVAAAFVGGLVVGGGLAMVMACGSRTSALARTPSGEKVLVINTEAARRSTFFSVFTTNESGQITSHTSRQFLEDYSRVAPTDDIVVRITTSGGDMFHSLVIAHCLAQHRGNVVVEVATYALSGGSIIALMAKQLRMSAVATLSPIDPQILGVVPARNLGEVLSSKYAAASAGAGAMSTVESLLHSVTQDVLHGYDDVLRALLRMRYGARDDADDHIARITQLFVTPSRHHATPIFVDDVRELLDVRPLLASVPPPMR